MANILSDFQFAQYQEPDYFDISTSGETFVRSKKGKRTANEFRYIVSPKDNRLFTPNNVEEFINLIKNKDTRHGNSYQVRILYEDGGWASSKLLNKKDIFEYEDLFSGGGAGSDPNLRGKIAETHIYLHNPYLSGSKNDCLFECIKHLIPHKENHEFLFDNPELFFEEEDEPMFPIENFPKLEEKYNLKIKVLDKNNNVLYSHKNPELTIYFFNRHYQLKIEEKYFSSYSSTEINLYQSEFLRDNEEFRNFSRFRNKGASEIISKIHLGLDNRMFTLMDGKTDYHYYGSYGGSINYKSFNSQEFINVWLQQKYKPLKVNPFLITKIKKDNEGIELTTKEILFCAIMNYRYNYDNLKGVIDVYAGSIKHLILHHIYKANNKNSKLEIEGKLPIGNENELLKRTYKSGIIFHENGDYLDCVKEDICSCYPFIMISKDKFPITCGIDIPQSEINQNELELGLYVCKISTCNSKLSKFLSYVENYNVYCNTEIDFLRSIGCEVIFDLNSQCHVYRENVITMEDFASPFVKPLFEMKKKYNDDKDIWIPKAMLSQIIGTLTQKSGKHKYYNPIGDEFVIETNPEDYEEPHKIHQIKNDTEEYERKTKYVFHKTHPSHFRNPWCRFGIFVFASSRIHILKTILDYKIEEKVVRIYIDSFIVKDGFTSELYERYKREHDENGKPIHELGYLKYEGMYKQLKIVEDKSGKRVLGELTNSKVN